MKNAIKKTIKFISSRALYFFIGVFLSIAIVTVYAALPTVSPGDPLTAAKWNELVNKVNELENRTPSHVDCYEVNLGSVASCSEGYFFTYIERSSCPGAYCAGTCCKPW